jgi:hypothetical protein
MRDRDLARFERSIAPEPNTGCWLWAGDLRSNGYGQFKVSGRSKRAHRVAYEIYKGTIPPGMHILHKCDVPVCVNPDHLSVGSNRDNVEDCRAKGRHVHGVKHGCAKIDEDAVRDIRMGNLPRAEYAKMYGISLSQVDKIQKRKRWAHIA